MTAMVRTEGVGKTFVDPKRGPVHACIDVAFEAREGEIFGLLGVNGAGKTTLLRILSTVLQPTTGHAWVGGHEVTAEPAKVRENIGFLSSTTALYGRLTARESLAYFGGLYGLAGRELDQRIDMAFDTLKLGEFADRLCDKLSTGQKQRVSIARTILHDPPVLFFDEPTSGLDVVTSQAIMEFVESVRAQGKTVVYCTHIMSEAERLCDRIAVIHDGRICGEGSPSELMSRTSSPTLEKAFLALVGYASGVPA